MSVILRQKLLKNSQASLWLDIYNGGQRKAEFLNIHLTGDKKQDQKLLSIAEDQRNRRELEILNSVYDFDKGKEGTRFFQYANQYINSRKNFTSANYQNMLNHLEKYRGKEVRLKDINASYCEGFKDYLMQTCKPGTVSTYLAKFKRLLNLAVDDGLIAKNPSKRVRVKSEEAPLKYLTLDELELLMVADCPNEHLKLGFLFSCFSGLRWSDINNLKWEDIQNDCLEIVQEKTKKTATIPLSPMAKSLLTRVKVTPISNCIPIHLEGTIFTLPTHTKTNKWLKQWCSNAGLKKRISYHWSRHTFGTLAASQGIDILTISKLMGHRKIGTTLIYAQVQDKNKIDAMERLPMLRLK